MINAHDYDLIQKLKNNDIDTYNAVQTLIGSQLEEFSYAAHEEKNLISFIGSSYQFITSHNPALKDVEFWNDINDSLHSLNHFMARMTLYRRCQRISYDDICVNDLLYSLPDTIDTYNSTDPYRMIRNSNLFNNSYSFNICPDNIHITGDYAGIQSALVEIVVNCCESTTDDIHISAYTSSSNETNTSVTICISSHGNILPSLNQTNTTDQTTALTTSALSHTEKNAPYELSDHELFSLCKTFFTTKDESHYGLGLSIVYIVCQKNNGILHIVQKDDTISVFLTFPVACVH